jgi:ELWxxDGT repeat protein
VEAITAINYYGGDGFNPQGISVCNGSLFFYGTTNNDSFYNNLFISDGTPGNATVVKTLNSVTSYTIGNLSVLGNKLIFSDTYRKALWSSDGTNAGTNAYAGILPYRPFTELNGKLYFSGTSDTANYDPFNIVDQLWVTDGTVGGTSLVKAINPTGGAKIGKIYGWNGKIYFMATDGVNGNQLWTSDGTASGTVLLKTINGPTVPADISAFTTYNNKLYFSVNDSLQNFDLWVSDGTAGGTVQVTHYNYGGYPGLNPLNFMVFNNKLYFNGADSTGYQQLWVTDGTAGGTSIVHAERDLYQQRGFAPNYMTEYNGSLYMQGTDSIHGPQLWKSDGTPGGTQIVTTYTYGFGARFITTFGNKLVFISYDTLQIGGSGDMGGICVSDGTAAGSQIYELPGEYNPDLKFCNGFVPFNNALYYNASYFTTLDYQVDRVVLNPSGIDETATSNFKIYPNPTNDYLQFKTDIQIASIEITDISGRVVLPSSALNGSRISVAGLVSGLYIIQASDASGKTYTGKFVKE